MEQSLLTKEKLTVNSLSTIAEDYADSKIGADAVYQCLRKPLVDERVSIDRKIPLLMAIDSILKNCKGYFISMVEEDAKHWVPLLHDRLPPGKPRETLERVWKIWREMGIFPESSWKQMGTCFLSNTGISKFQVASSTINLEHIFKNAALKRQMQQLLDEVQSEVTNELEKVSLERLAEINPDLLQSIKQQAETMLASGQTTTLNSRGNGPVLPSDEFPSFFPETRTPFTLQRSREWMDEWEKPSLKKMNIQDLVLSLKHMMVSIPASSALYSQQEAIQMAASLGTAGVTAMHLENSLKSLQEQETKSMKESTSTKTNFTSVYTGIDPKLFTNEGLKRKDISIISGLYEVGLPFKSSADGRRFKTQAELSKHLDCLFKKNQLEKVAERTEERGWYLVDPVWTGEGKESFEEVNRHSGTSTNNNDPFSNGTTGSNDNSNNPESFTCPADETQDRCAICDINFKMFFDNEDGMYRYRNCIEVSVMMDDTAMNETEKMLVHVTCWRALGCPDTLDMDQVLERHLNR
jgi:pre-mRNA cleavage complex 2 protein Pcf11